MSAEEQHHDRAERHARWLRSLGFSGDDFKRMKIAAEQVGQSAVFYSVALDDLDAPYKVAAVPLPDAKHYSGTLLGAWCGAALLAWTKSDREIAELAASCSQRVVRRSTLGVHWGFSAQEWQLPRSQ